MIEFIKDYKEIIIIITIAIILLASLVGLVIKDLRKPKIRIKCKTTEEVCNSYSEYLKSKHWSRVRLNALKSSSMKCWWCGSKFDHREWVGHHRTYKRLGKERKGDVKCVCTKCHDGKSQAHRDMHKDIKVPDFVKVRR